ncbi:MAG: CZB domain-containing protein [Candidatus Electrothrix sp. YB6]
MDVTQLQAATIAHLHWKAKLSGFFHGVEKLRASEVSDHTNCDFGKWLYSVGLRAFGRFDEMKKIEQLHKEVHNEIRQIVEMSPEQRKSTEGREALDRFREKCDRLVEILDTLEGKVKNI